MPKAYSYVRFSTPEQLGGDSLRRQTRAAREYAERNGLDLDESLTFHDLGVSAFRGKNAEEGALKAFRRALEDGEIEHGSYLLIENTDRFTRLPAFDASQLLGSIVKEGATVIDLSGPTVYSRETLTADPNAFIMFILKAMRSHEESSRKADNLRSVWKGKRSTAATKPLTSICPAWLELDREAGVFREIPERATIVRRIFADTLRGVGQHKLAATLNEEGVETWGTGKKRAERWHRSYVAKILASRAVIGEFTPHVIEHSSGKKQRVPLEPVEGYFPAVVDAETFERARAMIGERGARQANLKGRAAAGQLRNIFGGILRCADCGAAVSLVNKGQRRGNHGRYLVCSAARGKAGCAYRSIPYGQVEQAFLADIAELLSDIPAAGVEAVEAELRGLEEEEIPGAEHRIRILTEELADSPAAVRVELRKRLVEMVEERDAHRARRDELVRHLDAARGPMVARKVSDLYAALQADPLDRRQVNALLRQTFASVELDRTGGQLVFHWRQGGASSLMVDWPAFFAQRAE